MERDVLAYKAYRMSSEVADGATSIPASPTVWRTLMASWNSSKDTTDPGFDEFFELP